MKSMQVILFKMLLCCYVLFLMLCNFFPVLSFETSCNSTYAFFTGFYGYLHEALTCHHGAASGCHSHASLLPRPFSLSTLVPPPSSPPLFNSQCYSSWYSCTSTTTAIPPSSLPQSTLTHLFLRISS